MGRKVTRVSCKREYLNSVKRLSFITYNVAVKHDEPPFHLKIVVEICSYRSVAAKNLILTEKGKFRIFCKLSQILFCIECYQTFTFSCMSFIISSKHSFVKCPFFINL